MFPVEGRKPQDTTRGMIFEAREENSKECSPVSSLKVGNSHINFGEVMRTNLKFRIKQNNNPESPDMTNKEASSKAARNSFMTDLYMMELESSPIFGSITDKKRISKV